MSKLQTEIHAFLVHQAGGRQKNIKGVSQTTLSKMRKGESDMKLSVLASILEANGHKAVIKIESQNEATLTLNLISKNERH